MHERSHRSRGVAAVVALLAAFVAAGAWWWWGRAGRHLIEAERLMDAGRPLAATEWLGVPESSPATRERALLVRARAALGRNRPADAVGPLEGIDPDGPNGGDAAFWKGRTLYAAQQYRRAIEWFRFASGRLPEDPEPLRWLAAAAYDLGARHVAIEALGGVTRLLPRDAQAWRTLGLIQKEQARHEDAVVAYRESLAIDPDQPRVLLELAETLEALGDYAEAERQLDSCRGRVPEGDRAVILARCRRARLDRAGLEEALAAGLAADPDHAGLLALRAMADLDAKRVAEAAAGFDRALARDPRNAEWLYQRSRALALLGRKDEARRDLDRAGAINKALIELSDLDERASMQPEDPEIRCRIARLCIRLGKRELAASWFRAALACDPGSLDARAGLIELGLPSGSSGQGGGPGVNPSARW
jgi:tetratricopeptide (TPR) repeat protein